jgi:hypothetical protein
VITHDSPSKWRISGKKSLHPQNTAGCRCQREYFIFFALAALAQGQSSAQKLETARKRIAPAD